MRTEDDAVRQRWVGRLSEFLPGFAAEHPVLGRFVGRCDAVLHGSTTFGVDDAVSDLDFWLLLTDEGLAEFDGLSDTRFIEFELDGKAGHLNAESASGFSERAETCDLPVLAELRAAAPILEGLGVASRLIELARRPMRDEVRHAYFRYHYVEMRSEHRAVDNPLVRREGLGALLSVAPALAHAFRAALVLDGEPFPYQKWLRRAASRTATGKRLGPCVDRILDHLAADHLRSGVGDEKNPIDRALHEVRDILIESARDGGIDEPWLRYWYLYMNQARDGIAGVRWDG